MRFLSKTTISGYERLDHSAFMPFPKISIFTAFMKGP